LPTQKIGDRVPKIGEKQRLEIIERAARQKEGLCFKYIYIKELPAEIRPLKNLTKLLHKGK